MVRWGGLRAWWGVLALAACDSGADAPAAADASAQLDGGSTDAAPDAAPDAAADAAPDAAMEGPLVVAAATPAVIDPLGGSRVVVSGSGLASVEGVTVGGIEVAFEPIDASSLRITIPALPAGEATIVVRRGTDVGQVGVAVWSPAELDGARIFDAASGVMLEGPATTYEWQRVGELPAEWRVRDGNTTTWFPSTGRFWSVGGWNGLQAPVGFSSVPPDTVYPPENTTDEVWSSADGLTWELELPHGHGQFERRHVHSTVLWNDRLWMIGGDTHQGYYNHDVVSSGDGRTWVEEVPPGSPPWVPRALQITGVYNGRLWTGGGQDLLGVPAEYQHYNDLWVSDDGRTWTQVAENGPGSETRWAGCGVVDGFVEFQGAMWLVGCARYNEVTGHVMSNEVWSTQDGITWQRHADPPWAGKIWHNVVVWDDKLWALFGYTNGDAAQGWPQDNSKEAWYSSDGETWYPAVAPDNQVPGSHAQGVAVTDEALYYVGGNHTFGIGLGEDRGIWRFLPFRGQAVAGWTDRGPLGLTATAAGTARPVWVPDAFGPGAPGLVLDGSHHVLALPAPDEQPAGRTVLWVARTPLQAGPYAWEETYAPLATVVGGVDVAYPNSSVGLSGGRLAMVNREAGLGPAGEPLWARVEAGAGLQVGAGEVRLMGMSHAVDGTVTGWIDGQPEAGGVADYSTPRSFSRIGGSQDDTYYGPNTRFAGTLGVVIVLPTVVEADTMARIHAWAQGRFGVR